jgi:hypothetical protein
MAKGPKTEYLIGSYNRSIDRNKTDLVELNKTYKGYDITAVDGEPPVYIIEDIEAMIDRFDPSSKGLDTRIYQINSQIQNIQNQILVLGQTANALGCGTYTNSVESVVEDRVILHKWAFTYPNPFDKSTETLSPSNIGIGTYDGVIQVSIGTYVGFSTYGGICVGYANSITTLSNSLTTYRAERNAVISQINVIKEERTRYQIQKYGYEKSLMRVNEEINKKNTLINALNDPQNQQYFQE